MVGLFLLGMISRRAGNVAAVCGTVVGLLVMLWMLISPMAIWPAAWASFRSPFHSFMIIVVGTSVILIVGLAVSLLEASRRRV
jgi:SSS family solute:Na+ symporter